MKHNLNLLLTLLVILTVVAHASAPSEPLKNNPFKRPDYLMSKSRADGGSIGSSISPNFDLRAVILDGKYSLVNFGGKFYRLGDSVNQFVLAKVTDNKVVLIRDGESIEILYKDKQSNK